MATVQSITNNVFDSILPSFGNARVNTPIWNESQKMFIVSQYESQAGHTYYKGIRFSNNLVLVEKVGLYYTWKYIDGIELYTFNGEKPVLIEQKDFQKEFYDLDFIKNEFRILLSNYVESQFKLQGIVYHSEDIEKQVDETLNNCYKSFIHDTLPLKVNKLLPLLENDK